MYAHKSRQSLDPRFKRAFEALTPGRQRSYLYHFGAAKQSATRVARIEKAMPAIFEGRGCLGRPKRERGERPGRGAATTQGPKEVGVANEPDPSTALIGEAQSIPKPP